MFTRSASAWLIAALSALLFACPPGVVGPIPGEDGGAGGGAAGGGTGGSGGGMGGAGEVDGGEVDGGEVDGGAVDGGEPPDAGPYGLAARPANPTCLAPARPVVSSGVTIQRAFTGLQFAQPLMMLQAPGDAAQIFLMERQGRVRRFPNQANATQGQVSLVIDIAARVNTQSEGGLLGIAFHPQWATRKELFLSYTETGSGGNPLKSVVSRFKSVDNGVTFDPASEERIFELDQPYANHDGGGIAFGPDGFLYIGFGDGGSGGDPLNTGQRTNTTLGKFLRLNVDVPGAQKYAIPPTNPFATSGAPCNLTSSAYDNTTVAQCAEIYALGFRNPWRFSFDLGTGELWAGDVGQGAYEEVDRVVLGGNYGWKVREGAHCYGAATCATAGYIDPIVEYGRGDGVSITGGFVYRGTTIPSLVGRFIFGDYSSGRVWAVTQDPMTSQYSSELLQDTTISIGSFGQTHDGEVYALGLTDGRIYQLLPMGTPPVDTFPQRLSQTGCFNPGDPKQPVPALIPFDLNAPLWSDNAAKERFFALPDGQTITLGTDGHFDFPNGTVLVKHFFLAGKRIETRLFIRHSDGQWGGYSYEWLDDESDAVLLPSSKSKTVGAQTWSFPSRAQCMNCHTATAGRSLGPEVAQLNRDFRYPSTGLTRNQLVTLEGLGFFSAALPGGVAAQPRFEDPAGGGPVEPRARAYLHSNCSSCHRLGAGQGPQDFRATLTVPQMNICDVAPQQGNLGVMNARLLAPGAPATSLISVRMKTLAAGRMPPLGSNVVHPEGVALIDQWITSLSVCP